MRISLTGCYLGLGKTIQAIVAAYVVGSQHPVVVCPASAVENWKHELEKWHPVPESWTIISYASLIRRDWKTWEPDLVVLDEAHYAKSPSAKRTRASLGLAVRAIRNGGRAWLLSGTPMPNDPTELWPAIRYLWPDVRERLGMTRLTQWRERFCKCRPTPYGLKPYAVKNGDELRDILFGDDPIMLRRTLDDVGLELPPLRVELSRLPKDRAAEEALAEYEEWEETEYVSTLRRVLGQMKAPMVGNLLAEELNNGAYDKLVLLYYHKNVGTELAQLFLDEDLAVTGFDGSTSQTDRQRAIERFQEDPEVRVFLAQQTAAGIAINLTAANEVVLLEPAWSPEANWQALKRVHRIGQDAPCRARMFAVSGTLDEAILGTIHNKVQMQKEVGL